MNRSKRYTHYYGAVVAVAFFMLFFMLGLHYLGSDDFSYVLRWWMSYLVLGVAFQPLAIIMFGKLRDGGWMFAKTLGLAGSGWLMWVLASVKLVKFTRTACIVMVLIIFSINMLIYYLVDMRKNRNSSSIRNFYTGERVCAIIGVEAIFFCAFVFWCYLKGISPDAYGTERYMDYGFMMSMSKSDYLPPADMWLSGKSINYYYLGQYYMTYFTKLANVPVTHGYNIALMLVASSTIALSYSIGSSVMSIFLDYRKKRQWSKEELETMSEIGSVTREKGTPYFRPLFAGTISALAVSIAGNMHYPFYKFIYPKLQRLWGVKEGEIYSNYWFPDATRYIGYRPDVPDKTIHEFPVYSFCIGDLHAHVVNILFVMTVLMLMVAWLTHRRKAMDIVKDYDLTPKMPGLVKEVFRPELVLSAFLIGIFHTTNYWDFPIYFVVCGAIILFSNLIVYRYRVDAIILTGLQGAMFIFIGALTALPFTLTFDSISTSIGFNDMQHHSLQFQLMILWGLPNLCLMSYIGLRLWEFSKEIRLKKMASKVVLPRELEQDVVLEEAEFEEYGASKKKNGVMRFMDSLGIAELFIITIGLCAFGLVLLPELIYVEDIYGPTYQRANTMFKLTYQAFIMFGLSMGFIITKHVTMPTSRLMKGFGIVCLALFIPTIGYFNEAYTKWFDGYYKGLDATTFIGDDCSSADAEIIDYINRTFDKQYVVLEMNGLSYTYFNRISAFTGMPTVLGWQTHEWLWRSSGKGDYPALVSRRHNDVINIYTSDDIARVSWLIEKYNIDYIYIGCCEQVDGYRDNPKSDEPALTVQGKRCLKIEVNETLLKSLGKVEREALDNRTNQVSSLIRIDRSKTAENAKKYVPTEDEQKEN